MFLFYSVHLRIGTSTFHLMKWILLNLNEMSGFKVDASNGIYEVNVSKSFKI